MGIDPLALSAPWRTTLSSRLPTPWLMELDVGGTRVLITNHDPAGYAWPGPALHADEAWLVFAAAEVDRMHASGFRALLRALPKMPRPLNWAWVSWDGREPGGVVRPADTGELSLRWALARLGAEVVRLEVIEEVGRE